MRFNGTVNEKGELHISNRLAFDKLLAFKLARKKVTLEIKPIQTKRTLTQNAYIHVLFGYIVDYTGESLEEIKTIEKRRHLQPKEIYLYEKVHLVLPSTAELSNNDMSEFIEKVLVDCTFLGITVPTREELGYGPK